MRRALALAAVSGALLAASACGPDGDTPPAPSAAPATSAVDLTANTAAACETVDAVYTALDSGTRDEIVKGVTAEAKGDTATVQRALATLKPLFTSTAATFADAAAKAQDPQVKQALTALSEAVGKSASFTSFEQFQVMEGLTAPAEATLKKKCADAGVTLKNVE